MNRTREGTMSSYTTADAFLHYIAETYEETDPYDTAETYTLYRDQPFKEIYGKFLILDNSYCPYLHHATRGGGSISSCSKRYTQRRRIALPEVF